MTKREMAITMVVLLIIGVTARILPHLPNFAPVTATALFCGAYMSRRHSIIAPLAIMLISDYALLYVSPYGRVSFSELFSPMSAWHTTMPYVYLSFGLSALIGWFARRSLVTVALAAVACSVQFFLITNAGVWLAGAYERGPNGLIESYTMALPFFRGTLLGDLFYTAVFFGGFELIRATRDGHLPSLPALRPRDVRA